MLDVADVLGAAPQALPERRMLAIYRSEGSWPLARDRHHERASSDDRFLVRQRDDLASVQRGDGRLNCGVARGGNDDDVHLIQRRHRGERINIDRRHTVESDMAMLERDITNIVLNRLTLKLARIA